MYISWESNNRFHWIHSEFFWNEASELDLCISNQLVISPGIAGGGRRVYSCEQSAWGAVACIEKRGNSGSMPQLHYNNILFLFTGLQVQGYFLYNFVSLFLCIYQYMHAFLYILTISKLNKNCFSNSKLHTHQRKISVHKKTCTLSPRVCTGHYVHDLSPKIYILKIRYKEYEIIGGFTHSSSRRYAMPQYILQTQ